MANKCFKFVPDYVVPPGETLLEVMESQDITQAELVKRTGRPKKTISGIINGKISITAETALQLESVLGVPASFWLNLECNYQEGLARMKEQQQLKKNLDWLQQIPLKELVSYGWVKECSEKVDSLKEALAYFGVASVEAWQSTWNNPGAAYRKSEVFEMSPGALAAWLRKGEIVAQQVRCSLYNKEIFLEILLDIRALTPEAPEVFEPRLIKLCAQAGVAVVFVKELPKCPVSGVTRWLSKDKALIQMSLRYKTDDHFWFTFFHEAGHILKHGKRDMFLEGVIQDAQKEAEANEFASEFLIPKTIFNKFKSQTVPYFSEPNVRQFARGLGISPGIVVGRLQNDGVIPFRNLNKLKIKFKWAE